MAGARICLRFNTIVVKYDDIITNSGARYDIVFNVTQKNNKQTNTSKKKNKKTKKNKIKKEERKKGRRVFDARCLIYLSIIAAITVCHTLRCFVKALLLFISMFVCISA